MMIMGCIPRLNLIAISDRYWVNIARLSMRNNHYSTVLIGTNKCYCVVVEFQTGFCRVLKWPEMQMGFDTTVIVSGGGCSPL